MDAQKPRLPLLEQREIEARIVGPLVRAFASELGNEKALAVVGHVVRELARQSGGELRAILGDQTLMAFAQSLDRWRENGASRSTSSSNPLRNCRSTSPGAAMPRCIAHWD